MTSPSAPDLATSRELDLAALELDYEGFRQLATNPHLSAHEKIGFPVSYREGHEPAILRDILVKLPMLGQSEGKLVVDIGPGCAGLPRMLIDLCRERGHTLVLVDSEEMLAQLPDVAGVTRKCPGRFPANQAELTRQSAGRADAILCYSVLHYIYVDSNLFDFVDAIVACLAPNGRALIGDIPNLSKRRRFFASEAGQRFHREFTRSSEPMVVPFNAPAPGKIDDAVLLGLMQRAQAAGCDAYLLPQPAELPMANRRDDIIIGKP
jgi:hypothetical protein